MSYIAAARMQSETRGGSLSTGTPRDVQRPRCISCSGSGFRTGPDGVCTTAEDCLSCGGTGKPPKTGVTEPDGRGRE